MNDQDRPTLLARVGMYALAVLIGVIYGAVATVGHRQAIRIAGVEIPWGLAVALIGVFALLLGIRLVAGGRWVAAATAVGVVGIVALLTLPGPGGSVLVAGDLVGTIWAVGPALIAVLVVAWPSLPKARPAPTGGA